MYGMTKEQEIYKNMKKRGIYKAYGKYGITYPNLYCAIKDAGYDNHKTIDTIINNMENKGYIRRSYDGTRNCDPHKAFTTGRYIILKWEN